MATRRPPTGPLRRVRLAQALNQVLGTTLGPWDVGALDDATIDAVLALGRDLPQVQAGLAEAEAVKARIRAAHPTYGKRVH